jgi:deoxycytidine triphosphate deaminase/intein/homing endonuclease
VPSVILSDRTLREQLAAGRIVIEPLDESLIQPSSIDVRIANLFRVFRNHTAGTIDVKQDLTAMTELIEIPDDGVFMLHPGEFVLGSTLERIAVPDDLVARIEGKSSLGRLGLLIHSSLPASEPMLVLDDEGLVLRTIGEMVKEQRHGAIVGYDPHTMEVGYHVVTGFYEGPADRIYEVRLASGRSVRVTAGHNLFSLDDAGEIQKVRTGELAIGTRVAIPRSIPEPPAPRNVVRVLDVVPEGARSALTVHGPTVAAAHEQRHGEIGVLLREAGYEAAAYYRSRSRLPWAVAVQIPGLIDSLGSHDRVARRGERHSLPVVISVDNELAWLLGMYVAEGYRRRAQIVISNTDQARLDRLEQTFGRLGLPVHRSSGAVTCCSSLLSDVVSWLGMGGKAPTKRVPPMAFGWSDDVLSAFLQGLVDGDGSDDGRRTSVWATSKALVSDVLLVFARLGRRAACTCKHTANLPLWQVYAPHNEHTLLTGVPLPDQLLRRARAETGLSQHEAARLAGYRNATDLNNIERRSGREALRFSTIRRLRDVYARSGASASSVGRLSRLVDGGLAWDRVIEVVDTGAYEAVYDIEVRPSGRKIENFLAGTGGVFVANTAGFIDAGFDGHVTLELANVASLPITLYPGMKIGQVSFMEMTTPADKPYGSGATGSKYQGQRGPTPSRYFENFTIDAGAVDDAADDAGADDDAVTADADGG